MTKDPSAIFEVDIIGHEVIEKHVEYTVQCNQSGRIWTVKRRYRDFEQLNGELEPLGVNLELPPKKFFGNTNEEFITDRQVKLQDFLRRVSCHPFLFSSPTAAQFFELSEECLRNYENNILFAARNNPTYRLKRLWHACGWRYYKMHAELTDSEPHNENDYVLTWMSYGPDAHSTDLRKRAAITNECFKFLKGLPSNYFVKNVLAMADERGVHTISHKLKKGNMRDFTFMVSPKDSFLKKYRLGTVNSVFNDVYMIKEMTFFTRQLIEIIKVFDSIDYPFYNFHCGNIVLSTNGSISLMDYEFALTGHSNSDREALKRSKAKTVQEMRIFHLGATIYEFLTGSITVPYPEDMDELYEYFPKEFRQILALIFGPGAQMPTTDQLLSLPLFRDCVTVPVLDGLTFQIPKHVQNYFKEMCARIERRLEEERSELRLAKERAKVQMHLFSDAEKQRRRNIIQEHLKKMETK
ncbi:unnamed protein product [Bursaphelenchus okinawaensis]|uniref:PX domain-containing protein n=1 Tax=Bursaphelenchus okinawaensis TaxID=465554 RepID=A0A811KJV1_9BILA|nr:unnamed protein product [Bursaphelenchus okinawaensis]CAG9106265.1 unnamed protein product [Bursaphelenchus okinawaensis]